MRILLVNPPAESTVAEYSNQPGSRSQGAVEVEDFGLFPPLGLLYIISSLKQKTPEHEVFLLDCVGMGINHDVLAMEISRIRPQLIGITSFTMSLYDVCQAARAARMMVPEAHICMGGHHPIAFPFEAAGLKEFDSVIIGEGEEAFPALAHAVASGSDYTQIPGLYTKDTIARFRSGGNADSRLLGRGTVPPAYVENLDVLPFPDRSLIRDISYKSIVGASRNLTTMVSSRGCPYGCTYCDVPYKRYRQRTIASVADEVKGCLDIGYEEIHFFDDLFNITADRVTAFSNEILKRGYTVIWDFRGRVNAVTRESLVQAKKAGCRMISFGVETGSNEGLHLLKKNTTTEQIRKVFAWCREVGILTIADFMIGLPFEKSVDDVRRNIDFLLKLDPDYAQFSILSLFPNTELYADAAGRGLVRPERWQQFAREPSQHFFVDHWLEYLTLEELLRLQKDAYQRFYFRPRYIWRSLVSTRSWHEFTSKLQGAMRLFR